MASLTFVEPYLLTTCGVLNSFQIPKPKAPSLLGPGHRLGLFLAVLTLDGPRGLRLNDPLFYLVIASNTHYSVPLTRFTGVSVSGSQ